jgi:hypothetical protein
MKFIYVNVDTAYDINFTWLFYLLQSYNFQSIKFI